MGAWGPALFSDDVACDVRDDYGELITDGLDDAEATPQMLANWAGQLQDHDDGPVIWLALAVTQSKLGRLDPDIAARALEILNAGADLDRWAEAGPKMQARRRAAERQCRFFRGGDGLHSSRRLEHIHAQHLGFYVIESECGIVEWLHLADAGSDGTEQLADIEI